MAETSILKSSASPVTTSNRGSSATPHTQVSGPLPVVSVTMGSGGRPQVGGSQMVQGRKVEVFPVGSRPGTAAPQLVSAPPALSAGTLALARGLIGAYIAEQSGEGGNPADAELAQVALQEVEAMIAGARPAVKQVAVAVAAAPSNGRATATAPRRVTPANRQPRGPLPIVEVNMDQADAAQPE